MDVARIRTSAVVALVAAALACSSSTSGGGGAAPSPTDAPGPGAGDDDSGSPHAPDGGGSDSGSTPTPTTYKHVVLGFDDVALGKTVTNQYAEYAVFSSDAGCACETDADAVTTSDPNFLFTYYSCDQGETASIFADFAKPVRAIEFALIGVNDDGKIAAVRLVKTDGTSERHDITGPSDADEIVHVDVSSAVDVKRLELIEVSDSYGLGLDDLQFDFPN